MATQALIDTHVAVWLFYGETAKLSPKAAAAVEDCDLLVSPTSLLEIEYLRECKKISHGHDEIFSELSLAIGLRVTQTPFAQIMHKACSLKWTRDPFDRMLAAEALCLAVPLVTKDATLAKHVKTVW